MDNIPVGGQPCDHCRKGAHPVFNLTVDVEEVTTTDGRTIIIPAQTSVCQACFVQATLALLRASPIKVKAAVFREHLAPAADLKGVETPEPAPAEAT